MIMLLDELPAFIEGTVVLPDGSTHISHYHLTMNKDDNAQWSAGYLHYDSGRIILAVNDADNLDEIAIRLRGRLERWIKKYPVEPGMLQTLPKNTTLTHTNLTEESSMDNKPEPTYGQKLVGITFNPSGDARVNALKQSAADMIDNIREINNAEGVKEGTDEAFLSDYAIQSIITAQMAAVKRATWNIGKQTASTDTAKA